MVKVDHPCKGMTPAQRRDFELVAIGDSPRGGYGVIKKLEDRGLIVEGEPECIGCDAFGPIMRRRWYVPLSVHMQWCDWCSEQPGVDV